MVKTVAAFPIFVQEVAVTQVGDTGATNFAETGKRGSTRVLL
jgi:hypothetical protein